MHFVFVSYILAILNFETIYISLRFVKIDFHTLDLVILLLAITFHKILVMPPKFHFGNVTKISLWLGLTLSEYGIFLTSILLYEDKYGTIRVKENPYSGIFYAVLL